MDLQTKNYRLFDIYPELAREYAKRLHKKKEDIPYTQKFYSSSKAEASDAERTIVSYISTSDIDRDGEVLLPKGMSTKHYESSGKPVFWGHRYDEPKDVIGQCQWLKVDGGGTGVVAKTAFRNTEFADEVYQLYSEDLTGQGPILRGFSVGFIPLEWETGKKEGDPRRTYTKWELLEFSFVSIPCNPMAQTILGQKGIKLCDKLRHDLGLDAPPTEAVPEKEADVLKSDTGDTVTMTEAAPVSEATVTSGYVRIGDDIATPEYSTVTNVITGDSYTDGSGTDAEPAPDIIADTGADIKTDKPPVQQGEKPDIGADILDPPCTPAPETKAALPTEISVTLKPDEVAAALLALSAKVDALAARLAPAPVAPAPPAADADLITIDPEPDVLAGLDITPAASAPAPKSIETMTEAQVAEAVGRAISGLDIKSALKEEVSLALDKLKGRVR